MLNSRDVCGKGLACGQFARLKMSRQPLRQAYDRAIEIKAARLRVEKGAASNDGRRMAMMREVERFPLKADVTAKLRALHGLPRPTCDFPKDGPSSPSPRIVFF